MMLLKEDLKRIILEELKKLLDEINRRDFLKGSAAMCALGVQSACDQDYELYRQEIENKKGIDFPECVYYPRMAPDLNDSVWRDQVVSHQSQQYIGKVDLLDFMSQPLFDHEMVNVEDNGEFLTVTFANVPKDADILRFDTIAGTPSLSDSDIDGIFDTPQGEVFLTILKFKFKIFEYQGELYIHHPSYEQGGVANIPMRATTECSTELKQWIENRSS